MDLHDIMLSCRSKIPMSKLSPSSVEVSSEKSNWQGYLHFKRKLMSRPTRYPMNPNNTDGKMSPNAPNWNRLLLIKGCGSQIEAEGAEPKAEGAIRSCGSQEGAHSHLDTGINWAQNRKKRRRRTSKDCKNQKWTITPKSGREPRGFRTLAISITNGQDSALNDEKKNEEK